ncbi:MAG: hypothetical protein ACYS7Y_27355 [Planctomycetota bacterium]
MTATQDLLDMWEKHDGQVVTVGGLRCNLRVRTHRAVYPYVHTVLNVSAVPTVAARRTVAYRTIRAELRDDWDTDVLESDISVQSDILAQVG